MVYYSLPSGRLKNKPERTTKLQNLPKNYDINFFTKYISQIESTFDSDFHRDLMSKIHTNEDVQKYFLANICRRKLICNLQGIN